MLGMMIRMINNIGVMIRMMIDILGLLSHMHYILNSNNYPPPHPLSHMVAMVMNLLRKRQINSFVTSVLKYYGTPTSQNAVVSTIVNHVSSTGSVRVELKFVHIAAIAILFIF